MKVIKATPEWLKSHSRNTILEDGWVTYAIPQIGQNLIAVSEEGEVVNFGLVRDILTSQAHSNSFTVRTEIMPLISSRSFLAEFRLHESALPLPWP